MDGPKVHVVVDDVHASHLRETVRALMAISRIGEGEALARAERLHDPRFAEVLALARAQLGESSVVTDVRADGDSAVVTIQPALRGTYPARQLSRREMGERAERELARNRADMRSRVAAMEVHGAYGRPPLTALPYLLAHRIANVQVDWRAFNPHRYEELERQRRVEESRAARARE